MADTIPSVDRHPGRWHGRSTVAVVLEFLGSMNLAITLLVTLAIASVIGTVLQQNQGFVDYQIKFGPFWFDVFRTLGLFDVYSAGWFLFILAFLVTSTSACVYRHAPVVWREVTHYREHVQATSLRVLRNHRSWHLNLPADAVEDVAASLMARGGYRVRRRRRGERRVLAGMRGRGNRLGYLFTHVAIVVIAIGGLIDGDLPLTLRQTFGDLRVETRNLAVSQIPEASRLPPGTASFRGTVNIPEGQRAGALFVPLGDGYVVQDLPFDIRVDDFRIRHYASGQPKSFESDLVILDPGRAEPLRKTISVNDPLSYHGYTIYQANFQDGGSALKMRVWPLGEDSGTSRPLSGRVFQDLDETVAGERRTIELTDFDMFNVRPSPRSVESGRKFENIGPSFKYKLRAPTGEAREFHNYMAPLKIDGAWYFLSGVRSSPGEPFRYLHMPADPDDSPARFMRFLGRLHEPNTVQAAARHAARGLLRGFGVDDGGLVQRVAGTATAMVDRLLDGGFDAVERQLDRRLASPDVDPDRRDTLLRFSRMVLERTLSRLYRETLASERDVRPAALTLDDADRRFYRDALDAVSGLSRYDEPFWLQLASFRQVQATGLQITRAPGKNVVYFGFALLIGGVFLLFYVPHRRLWALVIPHDNYTELLLAGVSQRNPGAYRRSFASLADALDTRLDADPSLRAPGTSHPRRRG